jgi:flagellum-specific ATP synthase
VKKIGYELLQAEIAAIQRSRFVGRVSDIGKGAVSVSGLSAHAALGDQVEFQSDSGPCGLGEVVGINADRLQVLTDGPLEGLQIKNRVCMMGPAEVSPDASWLGRVIDPYGHPIDAGTLMRGTSNTPLKGRPINPTQRRPMGARMETGLNVFNTLLPIVQGQRIGLFAGSGVGKSTLMARLALGLSAGVVVIAMIGERGREVREFIDKVLGPEGMKRTVIVAATSDQSALTRRRCAWSAMCVAEYFRDSGQQVLLLADSITRFAEAHREVALAAGESSSLRGFPPSTAHTITALCERAGPGCEGQGDITAVFTVLVAGSDMEEPIADILRGVLDGHVILDREIAERGRFPAVDVLRSVSRSLPAAASLEENEVISAIRALLGTYERNEMMIRAGLYTSGSDLSIDAAIEAWPKIEAFLGDSGFEGVANSFDQLVTCLLPDGALQPAPQA